MLASELLTVHGSLERLTEDYQVPAIAADIRDPSEGPFWLTEQYMERVLRSYFNDESLKVREMEGKPALGKGSNYCGILTRLTVRFSRKQDHLIDEGFYIVKSSFEGDKFANQILEPYDVFNRELLIYETILPKMKGLLKEINDAEEIFAETIAVDYERKAIIFEDLNRRAYQMPDRLAGLDEKVAKLTLKKLAKMHAASAVLNEREGRSLELFDRGMFNRYTENYAPLFIGLVEACVRRISQWQEDKYSVYADKLTALKPCYMELAKRVSDPTAGHLNVLAHGDLWTTNLLVKYDEATGEAVDLLIIDFQYSSWGSPAIDLFYFLNTSLKAELHFHRQTELIKYYYDILADTLVKLCYRSYIPSLHRFHLQLASKEFYALHSSCFVLAVQRNEFTEDADFHALMETNERAIRFKDTCYRNAYIQKVLRHLLPVYERQGLLEIDQS